MKIRELTLYTDRIKEQKNFYRNVLGLKIIKESDQEFSVQLKNSILKFTKNKTFSPYHFAFTIPTYKISESLIWLKKRLEIIKDGESEIVNFPNWNAQSIYFYDADKNILEFIMRKNLKNSTVGDFNSEDILEISEIGLATEDFEGKLQLLTSISGIDKFSGGKEVFAAIGTERGLFILIDKNKKDWFPNNDKAYSSEFSARIETAANIYKVDFKDDRLIFHF